MNIKFNKVKWKNFLSYGDEFSEIKFKNGIDLISGSNGEGKSAMSDAIFYSLFGKPFRKIKSPSLLNRITKKKLEVQIEFDVDGVSFKIIRGMKPNKFEIYKKNKKFELIEQKAASKDYQKMLEEEIILINETIFRQLIVLGANMPSSKPFMELSQHEKESLFQVITDTSIFNIMSDNIKTKISTLKNTLKDYDYQRDILDQSIKSEKIVIQQAEKRNKDFLYNHEENIKITSENINNTILSIKKYEEAVIKLKKLREKYNIKNNELSSIKAELNLEMDNMSSIKNILLNIKNAEDGAIVCVECKTTNYLVDIDISKKQPLENKKDKLLEKIKKITSEKDSLQTEVYYMKEKLLNGKRIKENLEDFRKNLSFYESSLEDLNKIEIQDIDYNSLNEKEKKLSSLLENMEIKNSEKDNLVFLNDIVDTNNLKGAVIKRQIPFLNKGINHFLELFSILDYSFVIDENFKERIISRDEDSEFNQLSNGQKARISFSIMFSFLKLIEERNGVKTNILILDEILDSSVDSRGREELLSILKTEFSTSKNILIISHNPEIKEKIELFDRMINIKRDTYSSIEVEEI